MRVMAMSPVESTVAHFMDRMDRLTQLQEAAVRVIQSGWRFRRFYLHSMGWKPGSMGLAFRPLSQVAETVRQAASCKLQALYC